MIDVVWTIDFFYTGPVIRIPLDRIFMIIHDILNSWQARGIKCYAYL